jgi:diaminohydroxyphosphoribosylaminopyrimidine deaminase/5-amino-6-(5-phosphoribosylamino)uracil reductase
LRTGGAQRAGAVCVGIGTALADDPLLTARDVDALSQPVRVVFDSAARLGPRSRLLASIDEAPVIVVASGDAPEGRVRGLEAAGATVLSCDGAPAERVRAGLAELGAA